MDLAQRLTWHLCIKPGLWHAATLQSILLIVQQRQHDTILGHRVSVVTKCYFNGKTPTTPERQVKNIISQTESTWLSGALQKCRGTFKAVQLTWVKLMVKMAWERLLKWFIPVLAVVRLALPRLIRSSMSPWPWTKCLDRSAHTHCVHGCLRCSAFHTHSSCYGHRVENKTLTLYIGAIQGVLSHFQASTISGSSSLLEEVLHSLVVDLQIAGAMRE